MQSVALQPVAGLVL